MVEDNIIKWIQNWFKGQCDGNWEHDHVFQLTSTSNPG